MPFNWFRRHKPDREQAPAQAAAPPVLELPTDPPAEAAATDTDQKPKRRRGTRGGRNRKKPTAVAETQPKERKKPEPVRSQAEERRLQQR